MTNKKQIARRILTLGVFPAVVACAFLLGGFHLIQAQQIRTFEGQLLDLIESTVAAHLTTATNTAEALSFTANQILHIEPISHLSILDSEGTPVEHFGLPINRSDYTWLNENKVSFDTFKQTSFMAIPIITNQEKQWIVAGIKLNPLFIHQYRGYLLILFLGGCSLAWVSFFAVRLHRSLIEPMEKITADFRQALRNDSHQHINYRNSGIYSDLVDLLNDMIEKQRAVRGNMQNYVEQSTKELRETLETVEIQNIELDIARKNALQASDAKSEFLANTSHELRTPLNGILGFTSLLLKTQLTNQQRDYLVTIDHSAQGLLTVINDILDFSKLETGHLTLEYKPVLIRDLIEATFALYAPQAHEKNLHLLTIIHPNVPHNLLGDPHRLKQVLANLVSNAIKFSARGNIVIRAMNIAEMDHQVEIKFSVSDNGIGLTEEQQEQLFDAFSRVDTSDSRLQGGAGLGLAIAKGLIHRMRGGIGVESVPHQGATFWFTVPFGVNQNVPNHSKLANALYGLNVVVYDSNPTCRLEISHHLHYWGADCIEVPSIERLESTLLGLKSSTPAQVLILDSHKEENSFDKEKLLKTVQTINAQFHIPIVILAPPSIQRLLQAEVVGMNTVLLRRPVVHAALHKAICNQLNITQPLPAPADTLPVQRLASPIQRDIQVLVVDDNPANRKLACEFLKGIGVKTHAAETGEEALELSATHGYDLIFMDVQMPSMDGIETTRKLRGRETTKRTPVVALTAHAANEQRRHLLLAGMDDYLSKPVSESDLSTMIERWVKDPKEPTNPRLDPAPTSTSKTLTTNELPPSPEAASELFSWSESMGLAKNKADLARDMLKMLIVSIEPTKQSMQEAVEQGDLKQLLETVHKFHGGCCYCGVPALRAASEKLEKQLHRGQDLNLDMVEEMIANMDALQDWAEQIDIDALFDDGSVGFDKKAPEDTSS